MNLLGKFFKRDQAAVQEPTITVPEEMPQPRSVADYLRRGWAYHARSQEDLAVDDFRKAISLDPRSVDGLYGLGIVLKAMGKTEEAAEVFRNSARLIEEGAIEDHDRAEMLHRLSLGHYNELTDGDWNLEAEIWKRRK